MAASARQLRFLLNVWPPFWAAGIRVLELAPDWSYARVQLKARWFSRNYVGTHFGGSLFAMTDPFFMLLLMHRLAPEYIVWDKAGEIEFVAAKKEPVFAEFRVDDAVVEELRAATPKPGDKVLRWFDVEVKTAGGEVVARVRKQVYVRRKR
jgi:acyl-coenzyme A thioesterase PaaI-like protein